MLIRSIFEHKVPQDSAVTRLRCGGIFNDPFVTQSPMSLLVKELWKLINWSIFGEVMGKSRVSCFFDSRGRTYVAMECICFDWQTFMARSRASVRRQHRSHASCWRHRWHGPLPGISHHLTSRWSTSCCVVGKLMFRFMCKWHCFSLCAVKVNSRRLVFYLFLSFNILTAIFQVRLG